MDNHMENINKNYSLSSALMVYADSDQKDFYVEVHKIEDGKLLEGKPLGTNSIDSLIDAYTRKNNALAFSFMSSKVLAVDDDRLLWYTPAKKQNMLFAESLSIPNGQACVPALLWLLQDKTISVYALKSDRRPNMKSRLFRAPFHNIYASSAVCMGSTRLPHGNLPTDKKMFEWEKAFFGSTFTHLVNSHVVDEKTNVNLLWKELILSGKPFPKDVLVPADIKTLGELIRRLGDK